MIHTNISDSVVANWIKLENWNQDRKNYLLQRPNRFKPVRTGPYRLSSYGGPRGPRQTVVQMSPPDTFCPKPFNSFIFSPAMTHSLWVTILIMTHFYNFDLVWPSGRAKLIYLTSFDLQGVTASQSQKMKWLINITHDKKVQAHTNGHFWPNPFLASASYRFIIFQGPFFLASDWLKILPIRSRIKMCARYFPKSSVARNYHGWNIVVDCPK